MSTAILPAQDFLNQDKWDGHGDHLSTPRRKSNRSKRKVVAESPDYGNGKLNPKVSSTNYHSIQNNWNCSSRSSSCVSVENLASKTAMIHLPQNLACNLSCLQRPSSTPPAFSGDQLSWESVAFSYKSDETPANKPVRRNGQVNIVGTHNGCLSQGPRNLRDKGLEGFQPERAQKGVKVFESISWPDKTEGGFKNEFVIFERNERKLGKDTQMGQVTVLKRGEKIKSARDTQNYIRNLFREKPLSYAKNEVHVNTVGTLQPTDPKNFKGVEASRFAPKLFVNKTEGDIDRHEHLVVTSTERLGPEPSDLPKEGSGILRSVSSGFSVSQTTGDNMPMKLPSSSEGVDIKKSGSDNDFSPLQAFEREKWSIHAFSNSPPPSCLPLPKFSVRQNGKPITQVAVDTVATRDLRRLLGLD